MIRQMIEYMLQERRHQILTASDAKEALSILKNTTTKDRSSNY